ncbi:MAG TPA: carboxylating nicotinate-nucleotide diphosphorylase [Acidimicrobiia bacterium]|nr:carboxylating nicotinate-nucleotide diphosphorylase [Acidimicrobiia bacterium]
MNEADYAEIVERALAEDLGDRGDITSMSVIPEDAVSSAKIVSRVAGVTVGLEVAAHVFRVVDPTVVFTPVAADGEAVGPGSVLATVSGPSRSILTAERTALNLLGRMCGVATATAALVAEVAGTGCRITDTRKTMPGLRALDKHAVVAGGGVNHRMGLYDQVMIKDNHIAAAGDLAGAVARARSELGAGTKVVVEVESFDQLEEALATDADRVLLDNMPLDQLREAVLRVDGAIETEASGGVTLETARVIAETGVDFISVGWITHSAPQLDIALDFV